MKKHLLTLTLLTICSLLFGQNHSTFDKIIYGGDTISCHILQYNDFKIRYERNGSRFTLPMAEIEGFRINGLWIHTELLYYVFGKKDTAPGGANAVSIMAIQNDASTQFTERAGNRLLASGALAFTGVSTLIALGLIEGEVTAGAAIISLGMSLVSVVLLMDAGGKLKRAAKIRRSYFLQDGLR